MAWVLDDLERKTSYDIIQFPFLIGRNSNAQIICHGPTISKNHATITCDGDKLFITDTSTNGVFVNDIRITKNQRHELTHKSLISLSVSTETKDTVEVKDLYFFRLISNSSCTATSVDSVEDKVMDETLNDSVQILPEPEVDIIVIPDDEEDFLLSQLYCIKSENEEEPDEAFLKVKAEIAEMDKCDSEYLAGPILIVDEISSSDDELMKRLKNYKPLPKSPEIIFEDEISADVPSCSKELNEITKNINAKHTNMKPPVIDALAIESKTRKRKSSPVNIKETNTISKKMRKTVGNAEVVSKDRSPVPLKERRNSSVKIKTSESRGMFLIQQEPPKIITKDLPRIPKRVPEPTLPQQTSLEMTVALPTTATNLYNTTVVRRSPPLVKDMKCAKNIIDQMPFVLRLFTWESSFFMQPERIDITQLWPSIEGTTMTKMPASYGDYKYYQRAMTTVVMSMLFEDVSCEYTQTTYASRESNNRDKLRTLIRVTSVLEHSDYSELICECYLTSQEYSDRIYDYSLISFIITRSSANCRTYFGVVGWTHTMRITQTDCLDNSLKIHCQQFPQYKHTISILTKKNIDIRKGSYLIYRRFLSIRRYLNKLCAIKKVEGQIAKQILCPTVKTFQMKLANTAIKPHQFVRMNEKQTKITSAALQFSSPSVQSRFFLVQGPPGTGKSDLIVNIVLNLLKRLYKHEAVLLLAQTNAAVDNLIRRINSVRRTLPNDNIIIRMLRLGQMSSTSPDVAGFHVDTVVARHLRNTLFTHSPQLKHDYKLLEEGVNTLRSKKERSKDEDKTLKHKEGELKNFVRNYYLKQYTREETKCRDLVFERANLICSTIGSSYLFPNYRIKLQFKCCLIDEATQATEPDTLLPLTLGVPKFILVGDSQQLPAFSNIVPKEYLFSQSLFCRLQNKLIGNGDLNTFHMLDIQYRMHKEICSFPNKQFYNGKIFTHASHVRNDIKRLVPYLVLEQSDEQKTRTYVNHYEIDLALKILQMINSLRLTSNLGVTILTPYNDQKNEFRKRLETFNFNSKMTVHAFTVDSFQGQEQDIVILSLVMKVATSFVDDPQRLNVALTRARSALYVIGSPTLLDCGTLMRDLRADAQKRRLYVRSPRKIDDENLAKHLFLY